MTQEEHDRRVEATKHMTEFVIKIDNCFTAPTLNTGVFLWIGNDPYLIINTEDFGSFLTTDQLLTIETSIKDNNPALVSKVNPKVRCVKCPDFFNITAIKTDPSARILLAVFLHNMYSALPHTEIGKAEYSNFASRFHVYFTGAPAGLNDGTRILLNHVGSSPKDWKYLPDNKRYMLVGFYPDHRKLIVRTLTSKIDLVVDPEQFTFVDEMDELGAGVAKTFVSIICHGEKKEKVYKQAIIDLKNKLPKEEVVPQKQTPIKIVDLKDLPPGAGIKIDKNPPPVTTSKVNTNKVNKKKPSKSKPKASK